MRSNLMHCLTGLTRHIELSNKYASLNEIGFLIVIHTIGLRLIQALFKCE